MNKPTFEFKTLSPELEEVLMDELHTLKGGTGGDSDGIDLEEVVIIGDPPEDDDEEEEEEDPEPEEEDPEEPNPWDDPGGWWWGDGPEPEEEEEEEKETPCEKAKADGQRAIALLNNSSVQFSINSSLNIPHVGLEGEISFSIRNIAGNVETSELLIGTPSGVDSVNYSDSIADFHSHPNTDSPPSAADIIVFAGDATNGSPNMQSSFVMTQNGTMYAIQIDDRSKVEDFYLNNYAAVNQNSGMWEPGYTIGGDFLNAKLAFAAQGFSEIQAFERATALILKDSGMSLLKASPTSIPNFPSEFKRINATESKDSNGNSQYNSSECP